MTLPGTTVETVETPAAASPPLDTGTAFIAGLADRGSVSEPLGPFRNLDRLVEATGDRAAYGYIYDVADVHFREGGSEVYVARAVGPTPVVSTIALDNASNVDTLRVDAVSPGAWGDDIDVACTLTSGTFVLVISYQDEVVETLPATGSFADNAEAVAYANASSEWIRLTDLAQGDPKTQTLALAGGTDDRNNITTTEIEEALALFTKDLGPGQVAYPGGTTAAIHQALLEHADANNRFAVLDYPDTATIATIEAVAAADRALGDVSRAGAGFTPWLTVPGVVSGTTRTVPPSALILGLCARNDGAGGNPNLAPSGINGISRYAIGLSQDAFDNSDREDLNDAGVNVIRTIYSQIRNYGVRTLTDPSTDLNYREFPGRRELMAIAAEGDAIMESFMFAQLDGRDIALGELNGNLAGMLLEHYGRGALYGETPDQAFRVITDEQVNPVENIAEGLVTARLAVKVSPHAERVILQIQKTPITDSV